MFEEVQGRAIVLPLRPALPQESRGLDHSSPGHNTVLIDARRHFAAWASTITAPLYPDLPDALYSRIADNWRPLVAIAKLAGGDWPDRAFAAIEELRHVEHKPSFNERLFTAVRDAFDARARADHQAAQLKANQPALTEKALLAITAEPSTRLTTRELLAALNGNEECGLAETNHGRMLTTYWLREQFRSFPIRSQDWWEGPAGNQKHRSGYYRQQFDDTFQRYRISLPSIPFPGSGVSGVAGVTQKIASIPAAFDTPDAATASGAENPTKSADLEAHPPDTPDTPDAGKGIARRNRARAKPPNGAESRTTPGQTRKKDRIVTGANVAELLDLPPPPIVPCQPGTFDQALADEIRRLHRENAKRSLAWLSKKTGQPRSVVQALLETDTCEHCGAPLVNSVTRGRPKCFCSERCRQAAHREAAHFVTNQRAGERSDVTKFGDGAEPVTEFDGSGGGTA
jgi:hypothetical protein